jgi:hypothetical protein
MSLVNLGKRKTASTQSESAITTSRDMAAEEKEHERDTRKMLDDAQLFIEASGGKWKSPFATKTK